MKSQEKVYIHLVCDEDEVEHLVYAVFKNNVLVKTDFENYTDAENWCNENGYTFDIID